MTCLVNFLHGPWDFKRYERSANDLDPRNEYFTASADNLRHALARLEPSSDEDMLIALDITADLPFGRSAIPIG